MKYNVANRAGRCKKNTNGNKVTDAAFQGSYISAVSSLTILNSLKNSFAITRTTV